ncbi:MAG: hypothetical protein JST26_04725 [Bacteroidetes bacterium]|nr:hypothetical protein [Bacteroidota bacterium]
MMRLIPLLLVITCLSVSKTAFSQQQKTAHSKSDVVEYSKTYYYTFSGEATKETLELLREDLLKLPFVQDAKIEYKTEKSAGQVKLVTLEKVVTNEGDKEFSMVYIKQALINRGFSPADFRSEDTSR